MKHTSKFMKKSLLNRKKESKKKEIKWVAAQTQILITVQRDII